MPLTAIPGLAIPGLSVPGTASFFANVSANVPGCACITTSAPVAAVTLSAPLAAVTITAPAAAISTDVCSC